MAGSRRGWWYAMRWWFATFALLSASALMMVGCDELRSASGRAEDQDYQNFVDLAERADELGFTPYWLGKSFNAGGLTFYGPHVADFGADVDGGGVELSYDANGQKPFAELRIVVYSKAAWQIVARHQDFAGLPTELLGREARYKEIRGASRPVEQVRLIIETDDTVINAIAPALNSSPVGSPEQNPLLVIETFLDVVADLRPYPE